MSGNLSDVSVTQAVVVDQDTISPHQQTTNIALFNADGTAVDLGGFDNTGADILLTGYEIAEELAPTSATDTVNEALGKIAYSLSVAYAQLNDLDPVYDVALTGYVIDGTGGALASTDTILEAIAKLEKRIDDLENP